jgi:hypothetical protein
MRTLIVAQLALLALGGCVSVHEPAAPARTTVVTPAPVAPPSTVLVAPPAPGGVVVTRP